MHTSINKFLELGLDLLFFQEIGSTSTTAQVTPKLLCEALIDDAKKAGARVREAEVVGVDINQDKVSALKLKVTLCFYIPILFFIKRILSLYYLGVHYLFKEFTFLFL